jgi:hypothetical protein
VEIIRGRLGVCGGAQDGGLVFPQHIEPAPEIGGVIVPDLRRVLLSRHFPRRLDIADPDGSIRLHIAGQLDRLASLFREARVILIFNRINFAIADEDVFPAGLYAGFRTLPIRHFRATVLGRHLVRCTAHAIADLAGPCLFGKTGDGH